MDPVPMQRKRKLLIKTFSLKEKSFFSAKLPSLKNLSLENSLEKDENFLFSQKREKKSTWIKLQWMKQHFVVYIVKTFECQRHRETMREWSKTGRKMSKRKREWSKMEVRGKERVRDNLSRKPFHYWFSKKDGPFISQPRPMIAWIFMRGWLAGLGLPR